MRRIALAVVLVAALAPTASFARTGHALQDVPDAKECRDREQVTVVTYAGGAKYDSQGPAVLSASKQPERLAICVHEGGQTIFYFGGDMQSEMEKNDGAGGTCGAVIVADQTIAKGRYGEDWSRPGPDNTWGTNDDYDC